MVQKDNFERATTWQCRDRVLDLSRPLIMGIVNVTPDSFSDGGTHNEFEAAVAWGKRLAEQGADILDVGGESTRPGAAEVSEEEEIRRVVPVVRELAREGFAVSVDTSKPEVMQASLEAGACILNDIRAFELPGAEDVAAQSGAGLVIMHMQGTPQTMQNALITRICWAKSKRTSRPAKRLFLLRACGSSKFAGTRVSVLGRRLSTISAFSSTRSALSPAAAPI